MDEHAVRVRLAEERDVVVLAELHLTTASFAYADIFPADAPPLELAKLIDDWAARCGPGRPAGQECFVATTHATDDAADGAVVGVIIAGPAPTDPTRGHLSRLFVDPAQWQRGIGRMLHDHAIAHLRQHDFRTASLWVLEANTRARRWYERLGWRLTADRITTYAPAGIEDVGYQRSL